MLAGAAGAAAITGDAIFLEPNRPRLVRQEIPLQRLPAALDGLTIVQISDFHYDPHFGVRPIREAIRISNELQPDLVVLTGDFVTVPMLARGSSKRKAALQVEPCVELLRQLRARIGIFAALGNHDEFSDPLLISDTLAEGGFQVLNNTAVPIEHSGGRVWIAGVRDVIARKADLKRALQPVPAGEAVVLLAHEPDFADAVQWYPVDLQLSGHSHGGQVCVPLLGPIYLPELGRKYPSGLRQLGPLTLYTNVGIGTIRIPARWNCPPEVTCITLRAGQRQA
jgi:predicted MPP superfamily phosphohydrolase